MRVIKMSQEMLQCTWCSIQEMILQVLKVKKYLDLKRMVQPEV